MNKFVILAASSLLVLSACATGPAKEEVEAALKTAKADVAGAAETGFEWRDSAKFIKEAEEALAAGDTEKALKLAKKAASEGKLAQQQAKDQANAGPQL